MAGKVTIPFNAASSTFALEGEPSQANLALATMEVDQKAEHIAKTQLAVIPTPASKEEARGANRGRPKPWFGRTTSVAPRPPVHRYAPSGRSPPREAGTRAQEVLHI